MSIKRFIKEEKGVLVTDAIVSILIILLFTGIILTLIVNIVLESAKVKINSQEMDFATEILEYVEKISYEEVTENNLKAYVNAKDPEHISAVTSSDSTTIDELTTTYKIKITVEQYGKDENKADLIRKVTLLIKADLEDRQYTTEMSMLKKATMEEAKQILEKSNT